MKPITQFKIRKQFGLRPNTKKSTRPIAYPVVEQLAYLGYPNLYKLHLHFSIEGINRWRTHRQIKFPSRCCVSNEPADLRLPILYRPKWFQKAIPLVLDVPHSQAHYQPPNAQLIAEVPLYFKTFDPAVQLKNQSSQEAHFDHHLTSIVLYGKNKAFLEETLRLNAEEDGDFYPPWITFPNALPSNWKQGWQEYWFHYGWTPFQEQLGKAGYKAYLQRWDAPAAWIDHFEASDQYAKEEGTP
ncbi:MAG: hypothetical protein AAFV80_03490 [Bacteroidota bacterium]